MKHLAVLLLVLVLAAGYAACGGDEAPPADSDGDGWTDAWEEVVGTDLFNVDTDGDGYEDPADPDPLDAGIPAPTPSPAPTTTPARTPEATATATQGAFRPGPAEAIPAQVLLDCAQQFNVEQADVTSATVYQSTDYKTIFLPFTVHWTVPHSEMKPLAEEYVRLVKARVDVPPDATIGAGRYEYIPYVNDAGGLLLVQGRKCAECESVTWL
jgi:hypothetical protein